MTVLETINDLFTPLQFYTLVFGTLVTAFGWVFVWAQKNPPKDEGIELEKNS